MDQRLLALNQLHLKARELEQLRASWEAGVQALDQAILEAERHGATEGEIASAFRTKERSVEAGAQAG